MRHWSNYSVLRVMIPEGRENPMDWIRGAIQYSLEKYPEKYHELVMIFMILFKMFSVLILTAIELKVS